MVVAAEYSRACEEILGRVPAGLAADGLLFPTDGEAGALMRTVASRVLAEANPDKRGVYLSLLPDEVALGNRVLEVEYKALDDAIMLVLTDVTEARTLAHQVERERKRLEMIVAAVGDGRDFFDAVEGFRRFMSKEIDGLVASGAPAAAILADIYRQVHTFKGAFNQFSFHYLPTALHELEGRLQGLRDGEGPPALASVRRAVAEANCSGWLEIDLATIRDVLGDRFIKDRGVVTLSIADFRRLEDLAGSLAALAPEARDLLERLAALRKVSLRHALDEFDPLVQRVAERCGKTVAPLVVEGDDVLVDPDRYQPLLRALGHIFRNAVDHGIEEPESRLAAGKDEMGHIRGSIVDRGGAVRLEIADDGAGLDLARLRRRAAALWGEEFAAGLADAEVADLVFCDGMSTSDGVSQLSGRGVGLAAVRAAVDALGGTVAVASEPGRGVRFIFDLPQPTTSSAEAA
jgi:chemotaxis protein histidine kinase CheA